MLGRMLMTIKELYDWAVENECADAEVYFEDHERNNKFIGCLKKQFVECVEYDFGKNVIISV